MRAAWRSYAIVTFVVLASSSSVSARPPESATSPPPGATVLGTVRMGPDARLSAAIYDEHGQLVRRLYDLAPRSGVVSVAWDGKDDDGYDLPSGRYNWRAVSSGAVGKHDGHAGDRGLPVTGEAFDFSHHPANTTAVAYGPDGDLFVVSNYEETQDDVRRYNPADIVTGRQRWLKPDGWRNRGHAITADERYIYVAAVAQSTPPPGQAARDDEYRVFRRDAATGDPADWPDVSSIVVTKPWAPGQPVVTGIAVDGQYLWVSDTVGNRLLVFTKSDGKPAPILAGQHWMPIDTPRGIASDGAGGLWLVHGSQATRFTYDTGAANLVAGPSISGLARPFGLAWDQPRDMLYLSEIETGRIRAFTVHTAAPPAERSTPWALSNMPAAGMVTDSTVGWKYDTGPGGIYDPSSGVPGGNAAIAVSPDGQTLAVTDYHNGRTLFIDTVSGRTKPERLQGVNLPQPDVSVRVDANKMISQGREYTIDYGHAADGYGHPWQLTANWTPDDDPAGSHTVGSMVIRRLADGNEYAYVFAAQRCNYFDNTNCILDPGAFPYGGVIIYRLNTLGPGQGMRRVVQLRRLDPTSGPSNIDRIFPHLSLTTDTNGDGILDGDPADVTETSSHKGYLAGNPSVSVDEDGTIWLAHAATYDTAPHVGTARLPLSGFNAAGSPLYQLSDFTVLPQTELDGDPNLGAMINSPYQAAFDTSHRRLYTEVDTGEFDMLANYGGNAVRMLDLNTGQQSVFSGYQRLEGRRSKSRDSVTGLAVDSTGGYFYTGGSSNHGQRVRMYTWDGLPIAQATPSLPTFSPGWLDRGQSLTAFTHPNGTHYAYTMDNSYGTNHRYAFTNVDTMRRFGSDPSAGNTSGDFTWTGPATISDLAAWWRLDAGRALHRIVADSTANDHRGIYEGAQTTSNWWRPTDGTHQGALSFDGTANPPSAVNFIKNVRAIAPDNILDNPAHPAMTISAWFNTSQKGVLAAHQNTWPRQDQPAPSASVPALYIGTDGRLYGSTLTAPDCQQPLAASPAPVNDGRWHHTALVATTTGQILYLDGQAIGASTCGRVTAGLGYTTLGKGYTTKGAGNWPATPGGYFHYTGLLDDVRVYSTALTGGTIGQLATPPTPTAPFTHWAFDEKRGTTATDQTEHGKDGTVTAPTWLPTCGRSDGALGFNGATTQVAIPDVLTTFAPATISVWVKTATGGPILGDQRGQYPTPMINLEHWLVTGVGEPASNETIGVSTTDGTVRTRVGGITLGGPGKTADLRDNQWHHITLTAGLTQSNDLFPRYTYTSALYIDGTLISEATAWPPDMGVWSILRPHNQIGAARRPDNTWAFYTGLLDDLKIHTRVLSTQEIQTLAHPPAVNPHKSCP